MDKMETSKQTTIYQLDKSSVKMEWSGMPSDDIDIRDKNGPWSLKWAQFIYAMFYNGQCYTTFDKLRQYELLRLYGAGKQPREKYMDILGAEVNPATNLREGWMNVNWDIWSPANKFKKIILGRLESQDHNITVNAIDPTSVDEKENLKWKALVDKEFGPTESAILNNLEQPEPAGVKYVPESIEELEMYASMKGFKLRKEIDFEKVLNYTSTLSDEKQIRRKVNGDFVDINIGAYRDYYDRVDKKVKYRYLDPAMCVFDYSTQEDFKNMRYWAEQELYSIKRLRQESGFTEDQLRKYAINFASKFGNGTSDYINSCEYMGYKTKDGVYVYDNYKVPVMYCEWESLDKKYKTKKKTPIGDMYVTEEFGKVWDTEKKKTEITSSLNVYTCSWVIGSEDLIFNDGPLDLVPREQVTKRAKMTAHVYALPGQSIMESIMHNLDQLQLTQLLLQNALAQSAPSGLKIEFGSLSNIDMGGGNMSPMEVLKLYRHTGHYIYKATTHAGKYNNYAPPIDKLVGGVGPQLEEYIQLFELHLSQIAEASGIDRISGVSPKGGEAPTATEAKFSVAATEDALQPLYYGWISMKERAANNAAYRIQTAVKYIPGAYDVYLPVVGSATVEDLKLSKDVSALDLGIIIEAKPTAQEQADVKMAATQALKPGKDGEQISFGEYLLITQMLKQGQVKHAIAVLDFRLQKRKKDSLKMQQENIQLQQQGAEQVEKTRIDGELQKIRVTEEEKRKTLALTTLLTMQAGEDAHIKELQKMAVQNILDNSAAQTEQTQSSTSVAA